MILASTSTIYGSTYLDYIKDEVKLLFRNSKKIIFTAPLIDCKELGFANTGMKAYTDFHPNIHLE